MNKNFQVSIIYIPKYLLKIQSIVLSNYIFIIYKFTALDIHIMCVRS